MDEKIIQEQQSKQTEQNQPETPFFAQKSSPHSGKYALVISILAAFAAVFVFGVFFGRILFFPMNVKGSSMQPTLNAAYGYDQTHEDIVYLGPCTNLSRGDIIVFDSQTGTPEKPEYYIKRIVALPGETVSFRIKDITYSGYCTYELLVNGTAIEEPYIKEEMRFTFNVHEKYELAFYQKFLESAGSVTLGENEYYLLGDNRNVSLDSRYLGAINKNTFIGKVYLHVEYGDNIVQAIIKKIF